MAQRLILGMGSGRCGTFSLMQVLNRQPETRVTHEEPPLLPWRGEPQRSALRARLARMRRTRGEALVGDVGSFYLQYAEEAIALEPEVRIVCLKRPREEVVESFCEWLDRTNALRINHWAAQPAPGWTHDPLWTRIFPQYDLTDRRAGIRRYWDEYYRTADDLARRYPEHVRLFDTEAALNSEAGLRDLLAFVGIPAERQVLAVGIHQNRSQSQSPERRLWRADLDPRDPRRCAVLVPYTGSIVPECEDGLKELERRGYAVRRARGFAAIDQGRNQLATDALLDGFEETMWIDADVGFPPDAVDRLRAHQQPIVCGIYPQKGKRSLACHALPGTPQLVFGQGGGLHEILYAGTGFLLVRREVYLRLQEQWALPVCNERFGRPMLPYFQPMVQPDEDGAWYLAEDYAFGQRARQCGYRILADTSVRLWHIGQYRYGWEDAGVDRERYATFTLRLEGRPDTLKRD